MARTLFLHHNFPGQFKDLIEMHRLSGDDVRFICDTQYKSNDNVTVYSTVGHNPAKKAPEGLDMNAKAVSRRFFTVLSSFADLGWIPDVIYSHSGWGCGLYARTIFPDAKIIVFAEWWHTSNLIDPWTGFPLKEATDSPEQAASASLRNSFQALELLEASSIVTPTHWQKSQYPATIQQNISVIHEGVDTQFFSPLPSTTKFSSGKLGDKKDIIVTYASRGLEPVRCFPEFIKSVPEILSCSNSIRIFIAGSDKIHYYGSPPDGYQSYRQWALSYLCKKLNDSDLKRIKFLGTLPLDKYRKLLRLSDIHFYITRPFVASWSLLEAMSTGCLILAGATTNTKELLGKTGYYFNPSKKDALIAAFSAALNISNCNYSMLTAAARDRVCQNFSLHISRSLYQCL